MKTGIINLYLIRYFKDHVFTIAKLLFSPRYRKVKCCGCRRALSLVARAFIAVIDQERERRISYRFSLSCC